MSRIHVFIGPSLARDTVVRILPDAVIHPPVAHGDLMRASLNPGDRIALIDGVFHTAASVRHKEILDVLNRGAGVWGGASMGALRAAELASFGMAGRGVVYRLYARGVLDADDEVALLHDDEADWTARTVALVSVRMVARRLRIRGVLNVQQELLLTSTAREIHYTQRSWPALLAASNEAGLPPETVSGIRAHIGRPQMEWDVKSQDAVRVLRAAKSEPAISRTTRLWSETSHLARWRQHPQERLSLLVTAAQLYAHDYPDLHYHTLLRAIAGSNEPLSDDTPLDVLECRAVHAATERGLIPRSWNPPAHHPLASLMAGELDARDRDRYIARALVRGFRWRNMQPLRLLHDAIRAQPGVGKLETALDEADTLNKHLAGQGYTMQRVQRTALHRFCLGRWNIPALAPHLPDRGFTNITDLDLRGQPLSAYSCLTPPPDIALSTA